MWLDESFGNAAPAKNPRLEACKLSDQAVLDFHAPQSVDKYCADVKQYLTKERAIPKPIVDALTSEGKVFADSRRNAVFLCEFNEKTTGAEIRGTTGKRFSGMSQGSKRGIGFFTVPHPSPISLVVVESAIDALSYRALHPHDSAIIVSTAGVMPFCPKLIDLAKNHDISNIAIAYDNDAAGNDHAEKLAASLNCNSLIITRNQPDKFKDWNEVLCHSTQQLYGECA
jgi:hypothetical protein